MALSERTRGRLLNWKFASAVRVMNAEPDGVTDAERETITALAEMFGDVGGFDGHMAQIVRAAVWSLGVFDPSDEDDPRVGFPTARQS